SEHMLVLQLQSAVNYDCRRGIARLKSHPTNVPTITVGRDFSRAFLRVQADSAVKLTTRWHATQRKLPFSAYWPAFSGSIVLSFRQCGHRMDEATGFGSLTCAVRPAGRGSAM